MNTATIPSTAHWALPLDAPVTARTPGENIPLSPVQLRFLTDVIPLWGASVRICALAVRLIGPLEVNCVRDSLTALSNRHESLRTRILTTDGISRQHVDPQRAHELAVIDLSRLSADAIDAECTRQTQAFIDSTIDISRGPLFDARLLKCSSNEHVLVLLLDHMIGDADSCNTLRAEFWTLYEQGLQGRQPELPPLSLQYGDYSIWQQRTHADWMRLHEPYWRTHLADAPFPQVPCDPGLTPAERPVGAMQYFPLGHKLTGGLREFAARERISLPLTMLTAQTIVMSHWCQQRELMTASVSHGRSRHPQLKGMIGFLATSLYLRLRIGPADTVRDLLEHARHEFTTASAHQDYGQLFYFLPRCTTDISFNWLSTERATGARSESPAERTLRQKPIAARFIWPIKFAAFFAQTPAGLGLTVNFRPDQIQPSTVKWFGRCVREVAEAMIADPHARLDSLRLARP